MSVIFFWSSIAVIWAVLLLAAAKRPLTFKQVVIAIAAIGYSLLYETVLGELMGLYHYIIPEKSLKYIIISALLIYPIIEVIYSLFLPEKPRHALIYTTAWIAFMLAFEAASLYTGTVVLTGWKVIPWSIVTYAITFGWINLLFRYMKKRGL